MIAFHTSLVSIVGLQVVFAARNVHAGLHYLLIAEQWQLIHHHHQRSWIPQSQFHHQANLGRLQVSLTGLPSQVHSLDRTWWYRRYIQRHEIRQYIFCSHKWSNNSRNRNIHQSSSDTHDHFRHPEVLDAVDHLKHHLNLDRDWPWTCQHSAHRID